MSPCCAASTRSSSAERSFTTSSTFSGGYEADGVYTFGGLSIAAADPHGGCKNGGDNNLDFLHGSHERLRAKQVSSKTPSAETSPASTSQDTFHATKQLTLVAGIRWSPEYIPVDYFNRGSVFNMAAFLANQTSSVYPTAPAGVMFYGDVPASPRQFTQELALGSSPPTSA